MELMVATMLLLLLFTAFRVLFNVGIINTMRVNEEEVQGVSDTLPSTIKAQYESLAIIQLYQVKLHIYGPGARFLCG